MRDEEALLRAAAVFRESEDRVRLSRERIRDKRDAMEDTYEAILKSQVLIRESRGPQFAAGARGWIRLVGIGPTPIALIAFGCGVLGVV